MYCKKPDPRAFHFNPLPSGTLATFFLTAVGQIKHIKEGQISREKEDSDDVTAARAPPLGDGHFPLPLPPPPSKGQCVHSPVHFYVHHSTADNFFIEKS